MPIKHWLELFDLNMLDCKNLQGKNSKGQSRYSDIIGNWRLALIRGKVGGNWWKHNPLLYKYHVSSTWIGRLKANHVPLGLVRCYKGWQNHGCELRFGPRSGLAQWWNIPVFQSILVLCSGKNVWQKKKKKTKRIPRIKKKSRLLK